jgi:hypothetical protein
VTNCAQKKVLRKLRFFVITFFVHFVTIFHLKNNCKQKFLWDEKLILSPLSSSFVNNYAIWVCKVFTKKNWNMFSDNMVLSADTQNFISWYTNCNHLIHKMLPANSQNVIDWYTKCYQLIHIMLSTYTQNVINWSHYIVSPETSCYQLKS